MTSAENQGFQPTVEFVEHVHTALEQLYDFAFLQTHPLAQWHPTGAQCVGEMVGHQLRRELIDAIEALNPGRGVPFLSPRARLYHLLHIRYVDGMTVSKAANELGISLRQAHRDLRHGEESVAAIMWARRGAGRNSDSTDGSPAPSLQTEIGQQKTPPRLTEIHDLVERGHKAVERLADARAVEMDFALAERPVLMWIDLVIAQQVWISLLSYAVGRARAGKLHVQLQVNGERAELALHYMLAPEADVTSTIDPAVTQLAARLDWMIRVAEDPTTEIRSITIDIPLHKPTVLVIDDSAGLAELIDRYLTTLTCRVVAARNGWVGVQMAQDLLPDAIILDIMMPDVDGWEVLQTLRSNPLTAAIPVVICSVLNNPDLATSLGATSYLVKPIRRDDFVGALHNFGVV